MCLGLVLFPVVSRGDCCCKNAQTEESAAERGGCCGPAGLTADVLDRQREVSSSCCQKGRGQQGSGHEGCDDHRLGDASRSLLSCECRCAISTGDVSWALAHDRSVSENFELVQASYFVSELLPSRDVDGVAVSSVTSGLSAQHHCALLCRWLK